MKRGLTTLMTVAIALVSAQVMARAPIMEAIPSPIVGAKSGTASQTDKYIYPDAFDLQQLANDDVTPVTGLKWSYEVASPKYTINGVAPINSTTDDPNLIPATKDLNLTIAAQETKDVDKKPNTVTIRNSRLAPFTGTPPTDTTPGIIDTQAVTFYCSDGAAYTSQTVLFYTDNFSWGNNRLSATTPWKTEAQDLLTKSWSGIEGPFGVVTTSTYAQGAGICFEVPKPGNNMFSMHSKYGFFTLNENKVYRIRATMNCNQLTVGKTPFWDFMIENWNDNIQKGLNLYGMDSFYLDNENGANSIIASGAGTEVQMYWAPAAFRTNQWKTLFSDTKYSVGKDPYLRFRILDAVNNPGLMSDQKFGKLCMTKVIVESLPFSSLVADGATIVNLGGSTAPFRNWTSKDSANVPNGSVHAYGLINTQVTFGNTLRMTPLSNAGTAELATIVPATDNNESIAPPYTAMADDWPIAWQSKKLLQMDVQLSAPTSNDAAHPYEVIWFSMEAPTWELSTESYVTANAGLGSPKAGTPQTYTFFYWTGNETKSAVSQMHFLRWRIRFANNATLRFPNPSDVNNNNGAVIVHSVVVKPVKPM